MTFVYYDLIKISYVKFISILNLWHLNISSLRTVIWPTWLQVILAFWSSERQDFEKNKICWQLILWLNRRWISTYFSNSIIRPNFWNILQYWPCIFNKNFYHKATTAQKRHDISNRNFRILCLVAKRLWQRI